MHVQCALMVVAISLGLSRTGDSQVPANSAAAQPPEGLQKLNTTDGVEFGIWGRRADGPQPTLIVLASTIEATLESPYFRQCGNQLANETGWLCVSIDLPCHGTQQHKGETGGLNGWRERVEKGEDFVDGFNNRLAGVLEFLIEQGYSDPKQIAACGTSRGGFLALHFAASDPRVGCVAAFAPVTDLAMLSEFQGIESRELTQQLSLENHAASFEKRPVWIVIGDQDQRVSTDSAIHLARQITAANGVVELHVISEPRGHTTPNGSPEMAAKWMLSIAGK